MSTGLELGKVVAAGVRPRDAQTEQLVVFVLHRGGMEDFLPLAHGSRGSSTSRLGLEVGAVVPVKRIPKTTSGKIQRHLLEESFLDGEFDAELQELAATTRTARGGSPAAGSLTEIEDKLKTICDTALHGKRVGVNDNLFEIGASSLKLIEIHERIDHEYPGLVDLTELFDFPTIGELARHLQSKLGDVGRAPLAARPPGPFDILQIAKTLTSDIRRRYKGWKRSAKMRLHSREHGLTGPVRRYDHHPMRT